ncbi:MAG: phosphotransferase family protein [Acidimicrobiales bacterium]
MTVTGTRGVLGDPSALDATWLTAVLEPAGVARGAQVVAAGPVSFVGTGQMARNVRVPLRWDGVEDGHRRPASLIAKLPTDDAPTRRYSFDRGSYFKEYYFYTELRPTVGIQTPEVWMAYYDDAVPDFAFIMEDLSGSAQGDQFRGLTVDEAALAVDQAVALHAPRWGDPALAVLLGGNTEAEAAAELARVYAASVEPALARLAPLADEVSVELARRLTPGVEAWGVGLGTPRTLAHMDFRPDNLLFGVEAGAPPVVVVDWQTIAYQIGVTDVAYLIGGGFEPAERAVVERALVDAYHAGLAAAGVPGYDADTCWRDYRLASVWGVVMSIIATVLAEQTERGDRMLATMLRRHAHHAIDLDALELLG